MKPERILVRLPNWIGDVVMATPALRALRRGFAGSHLAVQLREELVPLLEGSQDCDEILPLRSFRRGALATWREGRALAPRNFDLGICFPDSVSSALLMRAASIPQIAGYRRPFRSWLLHRAIEGAPDWGGSREVAREHYLLHLVGELGCASQGTELHLRYQERDALSVDALLGSPASAGYVVLAPGAGNGAAKRWPPEAFARAAEGLVERGHRVVLSGAPNERELSRRVVEAARCEVLDLTGKLDLGGWKALLARADLLVGNDAGARHVAVAFGTPAVVVFGPTSLAKTDCNLERVRALAADVSCRPCRLRECPIDHRCMRRLAPDTVIEQADALARATRRPHGPGSAAAGA